MRRVVAGALLAAVVVAIGAASGESRRGPVSDVVALANPPATTIYRNGVKLRRGEFARFSVQTSGRPFFRVLVTDKRTGKRKGRAINVADPRERWRVAALRIRATLSDRLVIRVSNRGHVRRVRVRVKQ